MKKIYGLIWLLLLGMVPAVQAQKIVRGTVQDNSSKEALPGVTVALKNSEVGTTTDTQGNFQLAISRDTVTLVFSFVGFEPLERKIILTRDTTVLAPVRLKAACHLDFFYHKHLELSLLSGLHYTPLGGKVKVFYPYLIHGRHSMGSLRAEFGYQGGAANYQRNATLALDNLFVDCDHNVDVAASYQRVRLGERGFVYTRYTASATYTGKLISRAVPVYLAVGRLTYAVEEISAARTGLEAGVDYPFFIHLNDSRTVNLSLVATGRLAWWQDYWQFQSGLETQFKRYSVGLSFNKLGLYTEVTTRVGFTIERRRTRKPVGR
ncbi:carboxypeptidase-like regulatory domain-containing protein [Hymenobacter setariae]|uniref:Carboxypeptidase-like regulatory domain-containing protein n=1 Tax=Hymenobacter setariae TaxID=2594794 RepID=A0A558C3R6_9BACT|nr:carboxypeptidase-like regulatory domain-containing protein [Hymenobacter setariae]TVT43433.1 carboxypeptidase-like regulatory domain-containing protein [Hymenobacter setariae]